MKKYVISLIIIVFCLPIGAIGQELEYEEGRPIIDSDLDGLTDLGEEELFLTDPLLPDTDGDGLLDGAEVLGGSDPKDLMSPMVKETVKEEVVEREEDSKWGWYVIRASGMTAFLMLYLSFLFGLFLRIEFIKKRIDYLLFDRLHFWLSVNAVLLVIIHAVFTVLDSFVDVSVLGVLIPFMSNWEPVLIGIGTIAFYVFLFSIITSYFRKQVNNLFKVFHVLSIVMYFAVLIHALLFGTDFSIPWVRNIVYGANIVLMIFMILYMISIIMNKKKQVDTLSNHPDPPLRREP